MSIQTIKKSNCYYTLLLVFTLVFVACNTNTDKKNPIIPDTLAIYEGEYDMGWAIGHYMIYPKSENDVNRAGVINVSWTVNKLGVVENVKAEINKSGDPAEAAIARKRIKHKEVLEINKPIIDNLIYCIKLLKFIPAKKDGEAITSEVSTSVEFILI